MSATEYDYIIAGGGLAGLSLAHRLSQSSLRGARVLIIDRDEKSGNDHTWCFWSDGPGAFDEAVFHRWKKLAFHTSEGDKLLLEIGKSGFEYRMVRSSDLYAFIFPVLRSNPGFEFLQADIRTVSDGAVETDAGNFSAKKLVFDSVTVPDYKDEGHHNLLQHFLGWTIKTEKGVFDTSEATLFDFRVEQRGECRFFYVLPLSSNQALVEFTLFSKQLLERTEYEEHLRSYLSETFAGEDYEIVEKEAGVIPMSDFPHDQRPHSKVVRIGTAGGYVKPSTGYSFSRTQERIEAIVTALEQGEPVPAFEDRWKTYLDSVLLKVLENGEPPASSVFESLFRKNPPDRVLRFLDERTTVAEDLKLMSTVQLAPFTLAAISEAAARIRK